MQNPVYTACSNRNVRAMAIVLADRISVVDLSSAHAAQPFARLIGAPGYMGFVTVTSKGGWGVTVEYDGGYRYDCDLDGRDAAVARCRALWNEADALTRRLTTDPVFALETALKHHDWWSAMSDDHSVWASGEAASKRIQSLLERVPRGVAADLWNRYAPKEYPRREA